MPIHIPQALNMGTWFNCPWWWAGWPILFCVPTKEPMLATANTGKTWEMVLEKMQVNGPEGDSKGNLHSALWLQTLMMRHIISCKEMRQNTFIWMLESDTHHHAFHQSAQCHMGVRPKAYGIITMEVKACSSAQNPLLGLLGQSAYLLFCSLGYWKRLLCPAYAGFPSYK